MECPLFTRIAVVFVALSSASLVEAAGLSAVALNRKIAEEQILRELDAETPSEKGIDGIFFQSLIESELPATPACGDVVSPRADGAADESLVEVLFVSAPTEEAAPPAKNPSPSPRPSSDPAWKAFQRYLKTVEKSPQTADEEMAEEIRKIVTPAARTPEEKINFISSVLALLGKSTETPPPAQEPDLKHLMHGDLEMKEVMKALARGELVQKKDAVEAVTLLTEKLFPDYEVLVASDGHQYRMGILKGEQLHAFDENGKSTEGLLTGFNGSQIDVARVVNGRLRGIARVDTERGQLENIASGSDIPALRTGTEVSHVLTRLKQEWLTARNRNDSFSATFGSGRLVGSHVLVGVVKWESKSSRSRYFASAGGSGGLGNSPHFLVKAGADVKFQFVNPSARVELSGGIQGDVSTVQGGGVAPHVAVRGRLSWDTTPSQSKWKTQGDAQVIYRGGGPGFSDLTGSQAWVTALKGWRFQQVFLQGAVDRELGKNSGTRAVAELQVTPAGRQANLLSGVTVQGPQGAKIFLFLGAEDSTLSGVKSGKAGVQVKTRSGASVETVIRQRDATGHNSSGAKILIPIRGKSKDGRN